MGSQGVETGKSCTPCQYDGGVKDPNYSFCNKDGKIEYMILCSDGGIRGPSNVTSQSCQPCEGHGGVKEANYSFCSSYEMAEGYLCQDGDISGPYTVLGKTCPDKGSSQFPGKNPSSATTVCTSDCSADASSHCIDQNKTPYRKDECGGDCLGTKDCSAAKTSTSSSVNCYDTCRSFLSSDASILGACISKCGDEGGDTSVKAISNMGVNKP